MLATEVAETTPAPSDAVLVTLKALDGNAFKVPISILKPAEKLMEYLQGEITKNKVGGEAKPLEVSVRDCTSFTIQKLLEWLEDHAEDPAYDEKTFVPDLTPYANLSEADLVQFILAADLFGIPALEHTLGAKMAELINANENPEKIMEMFDPDNLEEEEVEEMDEDESEEGDESAALGAIQAAAAKMDEDKPAEDK